MPRLFMLHLLGGAGDVACDGCLAEAKRDRSAGDGVVSVAAIDAPGERCGWCGVEQLELLEHAAAPVKGYRRRLRIRSGGTTENTNLYIVDEDGNEELLNSVMAVTWTADRREGPAVAVATVVFGLVDVDVAGEEQDEAPLVAAKQRGYI